MMFALETNSGQVACNLRGRDVYVGYYIYCNLASKTRIVDYKKEREN